MAVADKNPETFAALRMPETVRPTPNTRPASASATRDRVSCAPVDASSFFLASALLAAPMPRNAAADAATIPTYLVMTSAAGVTRSFRAECAELTPSAALVSKRVAAAAPAAMNVAVYAIERTEKRELPQMPWPDVHPLPMPVPAPTSRPAVMMRAMLGRGSATCAGSQAASSMPDATSPPRNAKRQGDKSPSVRVPLNDPEIPRTRPLSRSLPTVATPRMAPPVRACTGWNWRLMDIVRCGGRLRARRSGGEARGNAWKTKPV